MEFSNVTVYTKGQFLGAYHATKCKWVKVKIGKYAQYPSAVHVELLQEGKRKPVSFVQTYEPSLVIAEGHNCPELGEKFVFAGESTPGVSVIKAKYSSCSPGWRKDFEEQVLPHLNVLANFHGHNSMAEMEVVNG